MASIHRQTFLKDPQSLQKKRSEEKKNICSIMESKGIFLDHVIGNQLRRKIDLFLDLSSVTGRTASLL